MFIHINAFTVGCEIHFSSLAFAIILQGSDGSDTFTWLINIHESIANTLIKNRDCMQPMPIQLTVSRSDSVLLI